MVTQHTDAIEITKAARAAFLHGFLSEMAQGPHVAPGKLAQRYIAEAAELLWFYGTSRDHELEVALRKIASCDPNHADDVVSIARAALAKCAP